MFEDYNDTSNTCDNIISKEHIFNSILCTMDKSLTKNQIAILSNTLSYTFENINFQQNKNMVSTYVADNKSLIQGFMLVKKMAGIKESSLKAYAFTLSKFIEYCRMDLKKVDTNKIRCFLLMCEKTMSLCSVDNRRRNLNTFFQYLEDEDYIPKNPCRKIPRIKEGQKVKKFYTDLEIETMRDSCQNIRELALIDLLISTGIRISEVCKIMIADIDWEERTILIYGKGSKERIVPISIRCKKHLKDYIENKEHDSEYLFSSLRKPYGKLSREAINKVIKDIGQRAGLPNITVHCFRRWFASDLNKKGIDPVVIQEILGHESFSTTQRNYLSKFRRLFRKKRHGCRNQGCKCR